MGGLQGQEIPPLGLDGHEPFNQADSGVRHPNRESSRCQGPSELNKNLPVLQKRRLIVQTSLVLGGVHLEESSLAVPSVHSLLAS